MTTLIRREFTVHAPVRQAWDHLAQVADWPAWAPHIRSIVVHPNGPLGAESRGVIRLSNGMKSTFRMTEFEPPDHWKWRGSFLWLTVDYDHRFEADHGGTRLIWIVEASGPGANTLGRLFANLYNRNLDRAVPRLVAQLGPAASR